MVFEKGGWTGRSRKRVGCTEYYSPGLYHAK